MRLIATFKDSQKALQLSSYLTEKGVENQLDIAYNTDWNSEGYGEAKFSLWIIEEDAFLNAKRLIDEFKNTSDTVAGIVTPPPIPPTAPTSNFSRTSMKKQVAKKVALGACTMALFFICIALFIATSVTKPSKDNIPSYLPSEPFITSPVTKELLFDYPKAYSLIDQVVLLYGKPLLMTPNKLPQEAIRLLNLSARSPVWYGIYPIMVHEDTALLSKHPSLFEKIREGEIWRFWTPAILHGDLLHLFFNMIWLVVIGSQLEEKLGRFRYLLFILLAAPISNLAQYLMSGSNFVGFSGVLCAQLTFIWIRQRKAPWEGYQLEKGAFVSVAAFVLGMFALQVVGFFSQLFFDSAFSLPIANTAHLIGALTGYVLGKSRYFASLL